MNFFETLENRHSIRRFTEQHVSDDIVDKVLRAALTAPSSKNCHSTSFIVVRDSDTLNKISQMREMGSAFISGAPVAIIVCGDPSLSDLWVDNAAISAAFLHLALVAEGLGSCWVHINGRPHRTDSDTSAAHYLRTLLPVPKHLNPLCVIALGYPAPDQKVVPRAELYNDKVIRI